MILIKLEVQLLPIKKRLFLLGKTIENIVKNLKKIDEPIIIVHGGDHAIIGQ